MLCPLCASEIKPTAIVCEKCGARRVTQRTPVGIFAGWAGIVLAIVWAPLLAGVVILPFTDRGLNDFPWLTLIAGMLVAAGLFWYSKSTIHSKWIRRKD
jgi:hypothetical protein